MGVYIKNQEMPTSCSDCFYAIRCEKCIFKNIITKNNDIIYYVGKKPDDCPLIEIKYEKNNDY